MTGYLRDNLVQGLRTSPFRAPLKAWALVPVLAILATAIGFAAGLLEPQWLDSPLAPVLPITLFVFPSLLEEAFFRGVLIPRNVLDSGATRAAATVAVSTVAFVAWHPVNALAFNHAAIPLFLDPWFLLIVAALGVTCGWGYVLSRSLWVPVLVHWVAVVVWVLLFGGRNLLLEL